MDEMDWAWIREVLMTPLLPNQEILSKNFSNQEFQATQPETPSLELRLANSARDLVSSLQKHSNSLQQQLQNKKISTKSNPEIMDIHADCVKIHKLTQAIIRSKEVLIQESQLSELLKSLSSIEGQLKNHDVDQKLLVEVTSEIKDLNLAITKTQQASSRENSLDLLHNLK